MKLFLGLAAAATMMAGPTLEQRTPALRAAPRIILVHGAALPERQYLTTWRENLDFVSGIADPSTPVTEAKLAGRRFVDLSLYWEAHQWEAYLASPATLATLDPADKRAGQGRLYLPQGDEPALLVYRTATHVRVVNAASLEILKRYGVK